MNNSKTKSLLRNLSQLGKFSVVFPVSLTAFTGYFLYDPVLNIFILLLTLGVFLQGAAASALNQVQENRIDSKMDRTRNRPLPAGRMKPLQAIIFVIIAFGTGSLLIYLSGNQIAVLLGVFTLLWYNGIYTPLKRITPFAVIPGSVTGAIPPVIGWTAAGGNLGDPVAILLAFLFFMGQVPHFWLLILKYGDQYKNAGLPSLKDVFSDRQINNLSFIWVSASFISALFLAYFGILLNPGLKITLVILTFTGILIFSRLINKIGTLNQKKYFILLNSFYMLLMAVLIMDKLIMG